VEAAHRDGRVGVVLGRVDLAAEIIGNRERPVVAEAAAVQVELPDAAGAVGGEVQKVAGGRDAGGAFVVRGVDALDLGGLPEGQFDRGRGGRSRGG
jgi:hypothetical protein